jgi:hypothetical protein
MITEDISSRKNNAHHIPKHNCVEVYLSRFSSVGGAKTALLVVQKKNFTGGAKNTYSSGGAKNTCRKATRVEKREKPVSQKRTGGAKNVSNFNS